MGNTVTVENVISIFNLNLTSVICWFFISCSSVTDEVIPKQGKPDIMLFFT